MMQKSDLPVVLYDTNTQEELDKSKKPSGYSGQAHHRNTGTDTKAANKRPNMDGTPVSVSP